MTTVTDFTSILSGSSWNGASVHGRSAIVTYSFDTRPASYMLGPQSQKFLNTFSAFTAADKTMTRQALDIWGAVSGLTFVEVADGKGDMRFGKYNFSAANMNGYAGFAYYPGREITDTGAWSSDIGGDVFINSNYPNHMHLMLHEIGHALGLKHSFQGDTILEPAIDNTDQTVMSYTGAWDNDLGTLDPAAIAYIYGDATTDGSHLSAWSWNSTTQVLTQTGKDAADKIFGTGVADSMNGGSGDDSLAGYAGNDSIAGGDGNDRVFGGLGDDSLNGGTGADYLDGNEGNDIILGGDGVDTIFGGLGNDRLQGNNDADQLMGNAGNDNLAGNAGADSLWGGAGLDTLMGGTENDYLDGGAEADKLYGEDGDDNLFGDAGNDTLDGGAGTDSLNGGTEADSMLGGTGNDYLWGGTGADAIYGGADNDYIDGGNDADKLFGDLGNDTIYGGLGNDTASGGDGADSIAGGDGADRLVGDGGIDVLFGGDGIDRLEGGAGLDQLHGGAGADTLYGGVDGAVYWFETTLDAVNNVDKLMDFNTLNSLLYLDDAVFAGIGAAGQELTADAFWIGTAAHDASDRVIYDKATGNLYFDADGNGAGAQIKFATLLANTTLVAADMVVI